MSRGREITIFQRLTMKVFNSPGRRIELPEHSAPILHARKRSDPLESQPQAMPIYKHLPVPYDAEYSTLAGYKAGHESVYRNIPMHYDPDPDFRYATRHWKNLLRWVSVIQVVRRLGGGLVEPQPGRNKKKTGVQRSATWSPIETSLRGIKSWEVPGTINGVPVNALPDWGSSVDAVSEGFARQLGLQIQVANPQSITLIGGHTAKSLGRAIGYFRFRGNGHTYRREFHVLRKSVYDVVLGRKFLDQTRTFTKFSHRIVERFRPCIQGGDRLFLMDESPNDRIRCAVNGSEASAFPDTGSELMLISGNFVRRNRFNVHREEKYRRPVELIDGSTVYTDGMVLNAELQFDAPPASSQELNLDRYVEFVTNISSCRSTGVKTTEKAIFICDLHVIEDLPCDIILSNEFIFENQVFSRFKNLFYSEPGDTSSRGCKPLDNCLLFVRLKRSRFSWLRQWIQQPRGYNNTMHAPPGGTSWEEQWEIEEDRRNTTQLWISSLSEPRRSIEQRKEKSIQEDWNVNNPKPIVAAIMSQPRPTSPLIPSSLLPPSLPTTCSIYLHTCRGRARGSGVPVIF